MQKCAEELPITGCTGWSGLLALGTQLESFLRRSPGGLQPSGQCHWLSVSCLLLVICALHCVAPSSCPLVPELAPATGRVDET